ncbi:MAG: succinate dehydrogenase assembly factor 2 [Gammaproteobacteria bacterium]|nr:succinate dehydrogenase assembly factor 2 [Gammaproteobacteria bacterium]MBU2478037.1 succinate dehydrogenase assembly factor 2 [Gammaproteobacteria bacterium]
MQVLPDATEINRLRWQCRRGMRELDLLLLQFLDTGYADLDATGAQAFLRLLDSPDAVLLEWLLGRQRPSDKEVADVVQRIRGAAAT